jgi:hypothetical protein
MSLIGRATSLINNKKIEDWLTPPLLHHHETAIVDSESTGHFLLINAPYRNNTKFINQLRVRLSNGETIDSTHTIFLDIPALSAAASVAHIFFRNGKQFIAFSWSTFQ